MRGVLIALVFVAIVAAIALVGFDVGGTRQTATPKVTTVSQQTSAVLKAQAAERAGSAGAGVQAGPGSASEDTAVGAPATAGIDVNGNPTGVAAGSVTSRPFAANSPWNTAIGAQGVDPDSARMIRLAKQRVGIVERGNQTPRLTTVTDNSGLFINTRRWTTPIFTTEGGVDTDLFCRQLPPYCGDGANLTSLPIPADASPLPQYDGYFVVEDLQGRVAYDMWRARRGSQGISYQFLRKWNLDGPGYQKPNSVSTRGSGLPGFAGYMLPDEIRRGRIDHALAIAVPGPARINYVQPASATDGVGSKQSLPEGARIRLKAGVRAPKLLGATNVTAQKAILRALRTYGAIVVERSKVPSLFAPLNYDWSQPLKAPDGRYLGPTGKPLPKNLQKRRYATPLLRGNEVQGITLDDFEVVTLPKPIYQFPPPQATESATAKSGAAAGASGATTTPVQVTGGGGLIP